MSTGACEPLVLPPRTFGSSTPRACTNYPRQSVRVDDVGDVPSSTTPEFVRLLADEGSLFVVWRCATDLCVVALDRSW